MSIRPRQYTEAELVQGLKNKHAQCQQLEKLANHLKQENQRLHTGIRFPNYYRVIQEQPFRNGFWQGLGLGIGFILAPMVLGLAVVLAIMLAGGLTALGLSA